MKKILLFLAVSAMMTSAVAQQDAQLTHFFFNNQTFNPGATAINDKICVGLTMRNQWVGFTGAPKTGVLNFSMPFARQNGFGITAIADQAGQANDVSVKASYSFHADLKNGRKLGLGIDAGIINKGYSPGFKAVDAGDASIAVGSAMTPDVGVGIFYKSPSLYFGVSSQKLLESKVIIGGTSETHIRRHYYITGGYNYQMNPMWLLKPSFLIKSDGTVPQFDVNALAEWNQKIFAGVTYRYQDAVAALVGYKVGDLTISYAYDFTTNGLKEPKVGGSQGTHEIYLAYCMKPPTPPKPPVYKDVTWL